MHWNLTDSSELKSFLLQINLSFLYREKVFKFVHTFFRYSDASFPCVWDPHCRHLVIYIFLLQLYAKSQCYLPSTVPAISQSIDAYSLSSSVFPIKCPPLNRLSTPALKNATLLYPPVANQAISLFAVHLFQSQYSQLQWSLSYCKYAASSSSAMFSHYCTVTSKI